jgi:protein-S-isoprenylcysteine O-methyltransferase Ste14
MDNELIFRITLAVIGTVYLAIRVYYTVVATRSDRNFFRRPSDLRQLAFGTLGFVMIVPEEAVLIAKFGDEYRAYMRRTGRFLPRLSGGRQ